MSGLKTGDAASDARLSEAEQALRKSDRLAKILEQRRQRDGMIVLNLPEVNLVFDDEGQVIDAEPEDNAYTHKLIDMFMVEANEVLARVFEKLDVPVLRRVHPEPTPGDVQELQTYARVAGYKIPKNPTRQELQALLDATKGTSAARAVHMAVLRTLTRPQTPSEGPGASSLVGSSSTMEKTLYGASVVARPRERMNVLEVGEVLAVLPVEGLENSTEVDEERIAASTE